MIFTKITIIWLSNYIKTKKSSCYKWTYGLSGIDYRVTKINWNHPTKFEIYMIITCLKGAIYIKKSFKEQGRRLKEVWLLNQE